MRTLSLPFRRWSTCPMVSLLALPVAAQRLTQLPAAATISAQVRGLEAIDGVPWATGPHYKAAMTRAGVQFVPALGRASPRERTLCFEMLSSGRAGGPTTWAGSVTPIAGDFEVQYPREGVVETYTVLADGLEQSFVFAARPSGSGDLVVRGRIGTDLPMAMTADGRVRFVDPAVGGVAIGGVVGVAADGRRVTGATRCVADGPGAWAVEYSLPAAFVDEACLPLVLDPFLAPMLTPGVGPDDTYPDVAHEATHDTYLFVWDRSFSAVNIDLVGQRFSGTGAPIGGLITIAPNVMGLSRNRVATVEARDAFVVAWYALTPQPEVWIAAVGAATGGVTGPLQLTTGGASYDPDVGVATDQDDAAIVVWQDSALGLVRGTRVTVSPIGGLGPGPIQNLSTSGSGASPVVSRHGFASGRLLVVWVEPAQLVVHGTVFDRNLQVLASSGLFANQAVPNTVFVDGDGSRWIVAYSPTPDVFCRQVTFDTPTNQVFAGPEVAIANQPGVVEQGACVAWLGSAAAIGFKVVTNPLTPTQTTSIVVKTIDGFTCSDCSPAVTAVVYPSGWFAQNLRFGVRSAGNGTAAEAMLTYFRGSAAGAGVVAHRFRSDDGLEWDRGGGCAGGVASHGCAVVGNAGYSLQLDQAPPAAPVFLLLGTATLNLACGTCTVVPDPATGGSLFRGSTSAVGTASSSFAIPPVSSLTGFHFFAQWLAWAPGGCLGVTASNALEIELQ